MNTISMAIKKDRSVPPPKAVRSTRGTAAFDLWLQRGLHQLFDDVAREPVPEDLLRLIEDDKKPN